MPAGMLACMAQPEAVQLRTAARPRWTLHTTSKAPGSGLASADRDRWLRFLLLVLIAFCAGHPLHSPDFFWHLAIGDVIRATGVVPRTDLFSAVAPDRAYVQFNWLWDLLASAVHTSLGTQGIRLFQALCLTGTFAGLAAWLQRRMLSPTWATALTALAFNLFEDRFRARPDAWTAAFALAILPLALRARRGYRRGHHVYAFFIGLLWSNIHGGAALLWLLSCGALFVGVACWALWPRRVRRPALRQRARSAALLLLAASVGLLLSPTTVPGIVHFLTVITPQLALGNEEWLPTYTIVRHGATPAHLLVAFAPTLASLVFVLVMAGRYFKPQGRRRVLQPEMWLLGGGYLLLAHAAVRNAFLCVIPLLCLLRHVPVRHRRRPSQRSIWLGRLVTGALLLVAVQDGIYRAYGGLQEVWLYYRQPLSPETYPVHAAHFIREAGLRGPIVNDGRWGGYLIHQLYPQHGVFVDTRHDLQGDMWRVFNDTHTFSRRSAGLAFGFARYGLELAVFPAPVFPLARAQDWQLLYKAGPQEVYQHRRGPHAADNFRRAQRYALRARAGLPPPLLQLASQAVTQAATASDRHAALITAIGAAAYLAEPRQQHRFAVAGALLSGTEVDQARGYRIRGKLWSTAGLYGAAAADYEATLAVDPRQGSVRARLALSLLHLGRAAEARALVRELQPADVTQLDPGERFELASLTSRL